MKGFNRMSNEYLGTFCKVIMEDALDAASKEKRKSALDVEVERDERLQNSHQ